jgi:hypothetical protein
MKHRTRCALLAAWLSFASRELLAIDSAGAGLDLVVLVDRSGSMTSSVHGRMEDTLLDLAVNVVAWSTTAGRVKHRFGLVSFGSTARVDVPLTFIDRSNLSAVRDRIAAIDSRNVLGDTDFAAALETAARLFDGLPSDDRRKRAVLILTDGCLDVPGATPIESEERIRSVVSSRLAAVRIELLLFGSGKPAAFWRAVSRDHVHDASGDRGNVMSVLHRAVTGIVGTRSTQSDVAASDTVVLPPYLDIVVFDVFHGAAGDEIAVFAPGASNPLNARSKGVEELLLGDVMSTIVVRRPKPGVWTFRKTHPSARVKILSQQFFSRGVLVDPRAETPLRQHASTTIAYRILDTNGDALREWPGYPLSLEVGLVFPDGQRTTLPMQRDRSGASLYRTPSETRCAIAGRYWTEVVVTTADVSGRPVRIFEDIWSGFGVEPANRPSPVRFHQAETVSDQRFIVIGIVLVVAAAMVMFVLRRR